MSSGYKAPALWLTSVNFRSRIRTGIYNENYTLKERRDVDNWVMRSGGRPERLAKGATRDKASKKLGESVLQYLPLFVIVVD
jgi:hypothetical protein